MNNPSLMNKPKTSIHEPLGKTIVNPSYSVKPKGSYIESSLVDI
jgi:hypothetical protein